MLKLIIEDDEGQKTVVPFMRDEITIGRQEGNTVRLTERNVSRHHARLVRKNGHVLVEDLGSYNGVRINGERIQEPAQVKDGDLIQIGDYDLALQQEGASQPIAPTVRVPSLSSEEDLEAARADTGDAEEHPEEAPAHAGQEEDEPVESTQLIVGARRQSTAVIRMDQVEANRPRRVVDIEADDAPRLVVVSPEFKGQEFACIRTEVRVGRTDDNDIALDHRSLSRTHAKIVREDTGEWRIIDMQSANGLSVNGESYSQASLAHGDLIELGHVKLRFIGPGHTTDGLLHDGAAKRSKKGLFIVLGLTLLGLAGGAAWFLLAHPSQPPAPAPGVDNPQEPPTPPTPTGQQTQPAPEQPPQANPTVTPEPPPKPAEDFTEKLQQAQKSLDDQQLSAAITLLTSLKDSTGQRPAKAEAMLKQAQAELAVQESLNQATTELDAHNAQKALKTLEAAANSTLPAFQTRYANLKSQAETALNPHPNPLPAPPVTAGTKPKPGPVQAPPTSSTSQLAEEAAALMKQAHFEEAMLLSKRCIDADPKAYKCFLLMGASQANLRHMDEGAKNYHRFLELAPSTDPSVPKVKKMLEEYEKQKTHPGGGK